MKKALLKSILFFTSMTYLSLQGKPPLAQMQQIMQQEKYQHATWGIFARDTQTGEILVNLNEDKLFLPGSTSKLFSVAALLHAYGDDYRFKTPVFALGTIKDGKLEGNLVIVGQGDLTMGGREEGPNKIAYTDLDHIIANDVPGVTLTPQNPLAGINSLAKQIYAKGIKELNGDVLIDDSLFKSSWQRDMLLSPLIINENMIDVVLNPAKEGEPAILFWRPKVPGYHVKNDVKTVSKNEPLDIQISADETGKNIFLKGSIPVGAKDIVRTSWIKDPKGFVRAAFIEALRQEGITVNIFKKDPSQSISKDDFAGKEPLAVFTSPPLSEYAKLILKVSQNYGADLSVLLLAAKNGKTTFEQGMLDLGQFTLNEVKATPNSFVFVDGAGGDSNRLTPQTTLQLLEYVRKLPEKQFKRFYHALPILGVDGSLAEFGKNTPAAGKVRAKPGTGVSFNLATGKFFLTTQALAGYIEAKNGHLLEFSFVVNNGIMPAIEDIFPIFEDLSLMAAILYSNDDTEK